MSNIVSKNIVIIYPTLGIKNRRVSASCFNIVQHCANIMKTTQSLPGIKFIGYVSSDNLQREMMNKSLAGLPVGIFTDITPICYAGVPTCIAESTYNNNGRIEQTTLRFKTLYNLPTSRHIAFVVTDCNGQSYIIGQREKPRPIVKITRDTGTPNGDPAVCSVEVTLYAQKSLIPCFINL